MMLGIGPIIAIVVVAGGVYAIVRSKHKKSQRN